MVIPSHQVTRDLPTSAPVSLYARGGFLREIHELCCSAVRTDRLEYPLKHRPMIPLTVDNLEQGRDKLIYGCVRRNPDPAGQPNRFGEFVQRWAVSNAAASR